MPYSLLVYSSIILSKISNSLKKTCEWVIEATRMPFLVWESSKLSIHCYCAGTINNCVLLIKRYFRVSSGSCLLWLYLSSKSSNTFDIAGKSPGKYIRCPHFETSHVDGTNRPSKEKIPDTEQLSADRPWFTMHPSDGWTTSCQTRLSRLSLFFYDIWFSSSRMRWKRDVGGATTCRLNGFGYFSLHQRYYIVSALYVHGLYFQIHGVDIWDVLSRNQMWW